MIDHRWRRVYFSKNSEKFLLATCAKRRILFVRILYDQCLPYIISNDYMYRMSVFKPKGSSIYWVDIYRGPDVPRLRRSTGTSDRNTALAMESLLKTAQRGNMTRKKLFSMVDDLMGWNETQGIPIGEIAKTYKNLPDHRESAHATKTRCAHVRDMEIWIQTHWPAVKSMHQISREAAIAYGDHLRNKCKTGKTFNNHRANLIRAFNVLLVRGNCSENVWKFVDTASTQDSTSGRAFTKEEMSAIYTECKKAGQNWYEVTVVARYTGLRYGDIANLKSSDIKDNCIYLRPSKTARKSIWVIIPMHPKVGKALNRCRPENDLLFPDHASEDRVRAPLHGKFSIILENAKIKSKGAKLSFHCLRHTFRTELAKAKVPQEIAMKLGGWKNQDTAELYNHDTSQLRQAIDSMS